MRKLKEGDIVLAKSPAGDCIPATHVRLLKRVDVKASKGNTIDWSGYSGWEAELTVPEEADMLRKTWSIPFQFPNDIKTFVFDHCILKKVNGANTRKNKKRKIRPKKS